jgi:hypothetical protein
MDLLLILITIGIAWLLWSGVEKAEKRKEFQERRERGPQGKKDPKLEEWQKVRDLQQAEQPIRRRRILDAARAGLLSRKQIAVILETSTQFGFSSSEVQELKNLRPVDGNADNATASCSICGRPALPGEDLCFSHHAK